MEFNRPEDAAKAATRIDHLIKGKKASVQTFKAKDTHQQKKVQTTQESDEFTDSPNNTVNQHSYGSGQFPTNPERFPHFIEQPSNANQFGFHYQPNFPSSAYTNSYANYMQQNIPSDQPLISRPAGQQRRWADFYKSLERADHARQFSSTYSPQNLRFNRLRALHN